MSARDDVPPVQDGIRGWVRVNDGPWRPVPKDGSADGEHEVDWEAMMATMQDEFTAQRRRARRRFRLIWSVMLPLDLVGLAYVLWLIASTPLDPAHRVVIALDGACVAAWLWGLWHAVRGFLATFKAD